MEYVDYLFAFDYEDLETLDNAIGEIMLRKVLHKMGINQRVLVLNFGYSDGLLDEIILSGMEATRRVFRLIGYEFGNPDDDQFQKAMEDYEKYFFVDMSLPELDGWSAQRLNPYRERWEKCFMETRYSKPYFQVKLRTNRMKQSVLRFRFDTDTGRDLFFQLPTLVENFLHWRKDISEVLECGNKRQVA